MPHDAARRQIDHGAALGEMDGGLRAGVVEYVAGDVAGIDHHAARLPEVDAVELAGDHRAGLIHHGAAGEHRHRGGTGARQHAEVGQRAQGEVHRVVAAVDGAVVGQRPPGTARGVDGDGAVPARVDDRPGHHDKRIVGAAQLVAHLRTRQVSRLKGPEGGGKQQKHSDANSGRNGHRQFPTDRKLNPICLIMGDIGLSEDYWVELKGSVCDAKGLRKWISDSAGYLFSCIV
ncbi:hypothetical protein D3C86_1145470 [compost metagenome]